MLGQVLGSTWPMPAITSSTTTATGMNLYTKLTARLPHLDLRFPSLILRMLTWKSWPLPCDLRLSPVRDCLLILYFYHADLLMLKYYPGHANGDCCFWKQCCRIWLRVLRSTLIWIRIRILPFTLIQIRILPFNLMQIRIQIRILPLPFSQS